MPLHFRCVCGVILNSPDGSAGRAAECPTCGKIIMIPQEAVSIALAEFEAAAARPARGFVADDGWVGAAVPGSESIPTQAEWPPPEAEVMGEPTLVISADQIRAGGGLGLEAAALEQEEEAPLVPIMDDSAAEPSAFVEAASGEDDDLEPLEVAGAEGDSELVGPPEDMGPPPPAPALPESAEVVPAQSASASARRRRKSSARRRAVGPMPRSQTAVVRQRGQRALAALEAVEGGKVEGGARRSRRAPRKKGGAGKFVLVVVMLLIVLAAGAAAALVFMPPGILPADLQEKVDEIKEKLNLPVESAASPGDSEPDRPEEPEEPE